MRDSLSLLSLDRFTGQLMSSSPVPGGGGVAALAGALAAGLGGMAVNLSIGKKMFLPYQEEHRRILEDISTLRLRFLALIDEDADAFEPLSRVYSMDRSAPDYAEQLQDATLNACRAPLMTAECCCDLIRLLEELLPKCSVLLLSDVGCAALSACCALEEAAMNVLVNTRQLPGVEQADLAGTRVEKLLDEYVPRARAVSDQVYAYLRRET